MKSKILLGFGLLILSAATGVSVSYAETVPAPHSSWSFREARLMPIQSGGRMKPFDSFASEATLLLTGKRSFQNWDSVDLLLSWLSFPTEWQNQNFIKITRIDVRRQLQLDENRTFFSPKELFSNFALAQYAQTMQASAQGAEALSGKTDRGPKEGPREQELRQVLERVGFFRDIVSGDAWLLVPRAGGQPWASLAAVGGAGDGVRAHFVQLIKAYQAGSETEFERAATLARAAVQGEVQGWDSKTERAIHLEVFYNHWHPFLWAWIFYLTSAIFFLVSPGKLQRLTPQLAATARTRLTAARTFLTFAVISHIIGFAIRCTIAGRPPVTNMYESILWVSFGVVAFGTILYWIQRQTISLLVPSLIATVGLIAANSAPAMMDPGLHPLVPVLRDNFWLTIHVLTITLGYSAFALTLGLANVTLWNFLTQVRATKKGTNAPQVQQRIAGLNQLTYRAMQFGVVLLAAGTILGGVWADYSWGRFWGWDPKEVWALIALLSYLVVLHGRMTSWIGPFAFAAWTVVGFLSVLMAWYGVNFILGVGLHSYGFSSGGTGWVAGFTILQLLYVGGIALVRWQVERRKLEERNSARLSPA